MNRTPAEQAKAVGLKSLTQVSEMTGQSLQTLSNWSKNKPELFKIVLLGCKENLAHKTSTAARLCRPKTCNTESCRTPFIGGITEVSYECTRRKNQRNSRTSQIASFRVAV